MIVSHSCPRTWSEYLTESVLRNCSLGYDDSVRYVSPTVSMLDRGPIDDTNSLWFDVECPDNLLARWLSLPLLRSPRKESKRALISLMKEE
jgi:hypothetical protein